MGTRSYIGRQYSDGSVRAVYCHWDGYPENNGRILVSHWDDDDKLECLLDEGDLSSLGEKLGEKHDFNKCPDGACNFYGRDRGEAGVEARTHAGFDEFLRAAGEAGADFAYLRESGRWLCWSLGGDPVEVDISSRNSALWGS